MSLRKRRNLLLLAIFHFIMLAAFLPGCKEGTKSTPASTLLVADSPAGAQIDLSGNPEAVHVVSGLVSSQNTAENLSNIGVKIFLNKALVGETKTTADGRFYFAKLPPGLYELQFDHVDYNGTNYIIRVLEDGSTQPEVPSVKLVAANPERLKIQAKIEGEVVLSQVGTKLANINVELEEANGSIISAVLTDSSGRFAFDKIGTGSYNIKAGKASSYEEGNQPVSVRDDGVVSPRYVVLSLTSKPKEERYSLIGTVVSQNTNEKLGGVLAEITQINTNTRTTSAGQFYFPRLAPGLYDVRFSAPNYATNTLTVRIMEDGTSSPANPEVKMSLINTATVIVKAKIEGEVVLENTFQKLANVNVELLDSSDNLILPGLTNSLGYYSFENIGTGSYKVRAGKASSYVENYLSVLVRDDGVVAPIFGVVMLAPKTKETTYDLVGYVVSQTTGERLANIETTLRQGTGPNVSSRTTSDGQFLYENLSPGLYDINFVSPDNKYSPTTLTVRILENGTISPESPVARMVPLQQTVVKAKIEGEILAAATGTRLANINVELFDSTNSLIATTLSNSSGYYAFESIAAGNYKVAAGKSSNYQVNDTTSISIRSDGVVSPKFAPVYLEKIPLQSFSITGYVRNQSAVGLSLLTVRMFNNPDLTGAPISTAITTGEGKFFFENISSAGMYYLKVSEGPSTSESATFSVRILQDGSTSPSSIEIPVTRNTAREIADITGKVYDAFTGGPIEYASVKIDGKNVGVTDSKGLFIAKDFLPGLYQIEISKFGYELLSSSFDFKVNNSVGSTIPASLTYPLLHNMKTGYGSIAGRIVNILTGSGLNNRFARIYKWERVTKSYISEETNSEGVDIKVRREATDWEVTSTLLMTTKTSDQNDSTPPELVGAFKFTHLAPGTYVIHVSTSEIAPTIVSDPRGPGSLTWQILSPGLPNSLEIRNMSVVDGQTTYWTNYEQPFVNP